MEALSRGECLWVVSRDEEFCQRAERELTERGCRVRRMGEEPLDTLAFWKNCLRFPGAVLIDVTDRLEWGTSVIRHMKRSRVPSPLIVVTSNPSQEFGTKIVSLGVSYILPREYTPGELVEVFQCLVHSMGQEGGTTNETARPKKKGLQS